MSFLTNFGFLNTNNFEVYDRIRLNIGQSDFNTL